MPAIDVDSDLERLGPPELPGELIDVLLAGAKTPAEITRPDGLLQRLTKRLVERAMDAELSEHLGYEWGQAPPGGIGKARNGVTAKTVHTGHGSVRIDQRATGPARLSRRSCASISGASDGFDDKIVAMYARGMSVRDIQAHLFELYGV